MIAELSDSPLFRIDPAAIAARYEILRGAFAGIVGYDVRTNPHPAVLHALRTAGLRSFSVCSAREAAAVGEPAENVAGAAAAAPRSFAEGPTRGTDMVFRNPFASSEAFRSVVRMHAATRFAVDGVDTIERLLQATNGAVRAVSVWIAAPFDEVVRTIRAATDAGLNVAVAFHPAPELVGEVRESVTLAAKICARAGAADAPIDLGVTAAGGPPAELEEAEAICGAANEEARRRGIDPARLRITPAAALVGAACSVITRLLLRKDDRVYLDEGRFGWLSPLGHLRWREQPPLPVRAYRIDASGRATLLATEDVRRFRAFGPTCDPYDELEMPLLLPHDIAEGDFIEIEEMGADSIPCATHFNGFYSNRYAVVVEGNS
jgi:ornithine decarboxylase